MKKSKKNIATIKNLQAVAIKKEVLTKVKGGFVNQDDIDG